MLGALYFSQGIPNGFFRHAVPVIFKQSGLSLEEIGFYLPALYLPWMFKLIWTGLIEKFQTLKFGRYRSSIILLQILTAITILSLSIWQLGGKLSIFVFLVFTINLWSSMQDIATDGFSVFLLEKSEKGWGNSVQIGFFWIGYIVGGGLLLILLAKTNWSLSLSLMAFIIILITIPVLFLNQSSTPDNRKTIKNWESILTFIKQPKAKLVLLMVSVYRLADGFVRSILPSLLSDWGLGFQQIGFFLGVIAPIASLLGAIIAGSLVNILGRKWSLLFFGSLQIITAISYLILCQLSYVSLVSLSVAIILDHIILSMVTAAIYSVMMDLSRKEYGGTDYTCQDCMGIFAIIIGSSVSYLLAGKFSYSVNFIFMVPVVVFCVYASIKLYSSITNEGIL